MHPVETKFHVPASSPVLLASHHSAGEAVPQLGPSLVHPRGLALFPCTLPTRLQEVRTWSPQERERGLFDTLRAIIRIKGGSTGSSELRWLIPTNSTA